MLVDTNILYQQYLHTTIIYQTLFSHNSNIHYKFWKTCIDSYIYMYYAAYYKYKLIIKNN